MSERTCIESQQSLADFIDVNKPIEEFYSKRVEAVTIGLTDGHEIKETL